MTHKTFSPSDLADFRQAAVVWLRDELPLIKPDMAVTTLGDIIDARDAWAIAHKLDMCRWAYGRDMVDAHIQTALAKIFPNAVFADPKRY